MIKSIIEKKNDIDFNKELVIKSFTPSENLVQAHMSKLINILPDSVTKKEIREKALGIIYREAAYNEIMEYLSKQFKYKISESELDQITKRVETNISIQNGISTNKDKDAEDDEKIHKYAKDLATKIIIKGLIYSVIQKDHNILVSDDDVKKSLESFHEQTKRPINEILEKPEQFEEIRMLILEDKTTDFLLNKFKVKIESNKK